MSIHVGEVRVKEMGYGMDEDSKTVAMSATTGKPSKDDTNVWNTYS